MSLETAIEANTAAVRELVAVWSKLASMGKTIAAKVESGEATATTAGNIEIPLVAPKVEAKKPAATPAVVEPVATTEPTAPATTATESPSELTYEIVGAAITQAVKTRRDHVVAVLAKFGAKKGTELKAEQYADFMKALG